MQCDTDDDCGAVDWDQNLFTCWKHEELTVPDVTDVRDNTCCLHVFRLCEEEEQENTTETPPESEETTTAALKPTLKPVIDHELPSPHTGNCFSS